VHFFDFMFHTQYKVILLGDGTVGKTSVAMRFTNDQFGQQYKQVGR
jgi:Ras-related protein Rab-28